MKTKRRMIPLARMAILMMRAVKKQIRKVPPKTLTAKKQTKKVMLRIKIIKIMTGLAIQPVRTVIQ